MYKFSKGFGGIRVHIGVKEVGAALVIILPKKVIVIYSVELSGHCWSSNFVNYSEVSLIEGFSSFIT